jgi:thiopurine S-methyltransferase
MTDHDFWRQKWRSGDIGFHRDEVHGALLRHAHRLGLDRGQPVFVPLCGKSADMHWLLGRGLKVLGVELSEVACEAFFRENGLRCTRSSRAPFEAYGHGDVLLLCGDVFDLEAEHLQQVRAVYDRAALVALPPPQRERYARLLRERLPAQTSMLLVSLDYEQARMSGPPFSVPDEEVRALFSPRFQLSVLEEADVIDEEPRFRARGLARLVQRVYLLEPHGTVLAGGA